MEKGTLLLVDISNYTNFINKTNLVHSKEVIRIIMNSLIKKKSKKLRLNKIEGDALFFYSKKIKKHDLIKISKSLYREFHSSIIKIKKKHQICPFCKNLEKLNIKFIVHDGEFICYKIGNFEEIIGTPVIEAHRLLKNNIKRKAYILITDKKGKRRIKYKNLGEICYNIIHL